MNQTIENLYEAFLSSYCINNTIFCPTPCSVCYFLIFIYLFIQTVNSLGCCALWGHLPLGPSIWRCSAVALPVAPGLTRAQRSVYCMTHAYVPKPLCWKIHPTRTKTHTLQLWHQSLQSPINMTISPCVSLCWCTSFLCTCTLHYKQNCVRVPFCIYC